jgi:DNA modification methylase
MLEINKIYCGDCLELMGGLPDGSIDLLLTDPPYGINADDAAHNAAQQRKKAQKPQDKITSAVKSKAGRGWIDYGPGGWDNKRPTRAYFHEMLRATKNQIIWGGNYFADMLPATMRWLVWDKGQRGFSLADGELAWTSYHKALRIIDYSRAKALGDGKAHPTQKAVSVMIWCILEHTDPGDTILDPFLGSGTTAVAALKTGRNFIGIEIDPKYCEIAQKRVDAELAQTKLAL